MIVIKEKESENEVAQSCPTLCNCMDCSPPGSSIHGVLQARILEWVASFFSRGSSQSRDRTQVFHIPGRCFTIWATREALVIKEGGNQMEVYGNFKQKAAGLKAQSREWMVHSGIFKLFGGTGRWVSGNGNRIRQKGNATLRNTIKIFPGWNQESIVEGWGDFEEGGPKEKYQSYLRVTNFNIWSRGMIWSDLSFIKIPFICGE